MLVCRAILDHLAQLAPNKLVWLLMDLQDLPEILESQDFPVRLAKEESEANVVTLASVEHVATKV